MSVKSATTLRCANMIPAFFTKPNMDQLSTFVTKLSQQDRNKLEEIIYALAKSDGENPKEWGWGKKHLMDSDIRLTAAFFQMLKNSLKDELIANSGCSRQIADLIIKTCPLLDRIDISNEVRNDLIQRARLFDRLEKQKNSLNQKYPELCICTQDPHELRSKSWRAQEALLMTFPTLMTCQEIQRFEHFSSVVQELIQGNADSISAQLILDRLLKKESARVSTPDLNDHIRLLHVKQIAQRQIASGEINHEGGTNTYAVPSSEYRQGTLRLKGSGGASGEVYRYRSDRALGIGMTPPTMAMNQIPLIKRIRLIKHLVLSAIYLRKESENDAADQHIQRVFSILNASDFPAEVRNSIFKEMYMLCGDNRWIDQLGEKLFLDQQGFSTTDYQKQFALVNYIRSAEFEIHSNKYGLDGSVQIEENLSSKRACEYINDQGGQKLKTAPKTLVHFFAFLGMLKGSMNSDLDKTLIEFDEIAQRVVNFCDTQNEPNQTSIRDFTSFRLWQLGLPQCAVPFDRAFLLLFSDPAMVAKIKQLKSSNKIAPSLFDDQIQRLDKMLAVFTEELKKPKITLTPRDLFLTLFEEKESPIEGDLNHHSVETLTSEKSSSFTDGAFPLYKASADRFAELLKSQCPLAKEISKGEHVRFDLEQRANILSRLEWFKRDLNTKYPDLKCSTLESENPIGIAWKAQETFLMTLPVCMTEKEKAHFESLFLVMEELVLGNYDPQTAKIILEKLLVREHLRATSYDLEADLTLRNINKITKMQIAQNALSKGKESLYKDIFLVPSQEQKVGKFKPLERAAAVKEVFSYRCDRVLGMGMTAPTASLFHNNLSKRVLRIESLINKAAKLRMDKDHDAADLKVKEAFSIISAEDFPAQARNAIFGHMDRLHGSGRSNIEEGEKLFYNTEKTAAFDRKRALAIQSYLESDAYTNHQTKFSRGGSVQIWLNGDVARAYDCITKDPEGGEKLKSAPKILVHFNALLGIIKGSMDCSSGNTFIEFDETGKNVVNLWDFDDERSLPASNQYHKFRLWQLGLPQSDQPFDRAFLLLFANPSLLDKLKRTQSSPQIPKLEYEAQVERFAHIIQLFQEELKKPIPTLTPRALFFHLFGGEMHVNDVEQRVNNENQLGRPISPLELFEFHIANWGKNGNYDSRRKQTVEQNINVLYSPINRGNPSYQREKMRQP